MAVSLISRTFTDKAVSTLTGLASGKAAIAVEQRVAAALEKSPNALVQTLGCAAEYVTALSVGASVDAGVGSVVDYLRGDKIDTNSIQRRAFSGAAIGLIGRFLNPVKATKTLPPSPAQRK
jgi:hypothetical protein